MDMQMPEMDGLEATRLLRSEPAFRELPIIAMTANATKQELDACLEAGMNDHITKPVDRTAMLETLRRWLPRTAPGESAAPPPAPVPIESAPPVLEGINVADALKRLGLGFDSLRKMLIRFADGQVQTLDDLRAAVAAGDIKAAARQAHAIAGAAGNLGADDLRAAAKALEQAGRDGRRDLDGLVTTSNSGPDRPAPHRLAAGQRRRRTGADGGAVRSHPVASRPRTPGGRAEQLRFIGLERGPLRTGRHRPARGPGRRPARVRERWTATNTTRPTGLSRTCCKREPSRRTVMKELSECRVLVVDDVKANVDVLVQALRQDHKLSVALDGDPPFAASRKALPTGPARHRHAGHRRLRVCRRLRAAPAAARRAGHVPQLAGGGQPKTLASRWAERLPHQAFRGA